MSVPPRISARLSSRSRARVLWIAFALAAGATGYGVHRLYEIVRRELHEQSTQAARRELERARDTIQGETDALRVATIKKLAGLHVDGLGPALRQWDDSDSSVIGTFQWEPARGFLPGSKVPPPMNDVSALWRAFPPDSRSQTADTPAAAIADYQIHACRTVGDPAFPASELGYQAENLELLAYAGRKVDPWAGWAGHRADPSRPWTFWYRAGPDAAVRGCFVDPQPVIARLREKLTDAKIARLALAFAHGPDATASAAERLDLASSLPGYALRAEEGEVFAAKQSSARLSALAVALLLGVFLLGGALLAAFARREAREAERKTTFVTQVSHELRTPLTSIQMFADMLGATGLPDEKRQKFAGMIGRETQRLSALIERLLTFSALEKKTVAVAIAPLDVGAVVRETLEEMNAPLHAAGLQTETEIPPQPLRALSDPSALKQALLNLLDNAQKYARAGKVVRIALAQSHGHVRVRVSDRGPGIPRALGERAFEPFTQGGQSLSDKSPGVGLGLSIARGLLRQAGGDVVLLPSELGACFEIRLPVAPP